MHTFKIAGLLLAAATSISANARILQTSPSVSPGVSPHVSPSPTMGTASGTPTAWPSAAATPTSSPVCQPPPLLSNEYFVMTDSTGRTSNDLGNFDHCLSSALAQYCILTAGNVSYGVCVPSHCTVEDISNPNLGIISFLISLIPILLFLDPYDAEFTCTNHSSEDWTAGAIAMIAITCVLVVFVAFGTVLDFLDRRQRIRARSQMEHFDGNQDAMAQHAQNGADADIAQSSLAPAPIMPFGSLNAAPSNPFGEDQPRASMPISIPTARRMRIKSTPQMFGGSIPESYGPPSPAEGFMPHSYGQSGPDESMLGRSPQGILLTSVRRPVLSSSVHSPEPYEYASASRQGADKQEPSMLYSPTSRANASYTANDRAAATSMSRSAARADEEALSGDWLRAGLKCFSLSQTLGQLLDYARPDPNHINALDGIRVISLCWVILGHVVMFMAILGFSNSQDVIPPGGAFGSWPFQIVPASEFALDTFLVLSGFLGTFKLISLLRSKGVPKLTLGDLWAFNWHRSWRLFPALAYVVGLNLFLVPIVPSGPFKSPLAAGRTHCDEYWWATLLFVNNFVPYTDNFANQCMGWTFSLSLDRQLYLLIPLVVLIYISLPLAGVVFVVMSFLFSLIVAGVIVSRNDLTSIISFSLPVDYSYNDMYFSKPWMRASPFLVGMLLAFAWDYIKRARVRQEQAASMPANKLGIETFAAMHTGDRKPRTPFFTLSRTSQLFIISVAVAVCCMLIYSPVKAYSTRGNGWDSDSNVAYTVLARPTWALAVAAVLLVLISQKSSILGALLGHQVWRPVARLSYGIFLLHPLVIQLLYGTQIQYFRFTTINIIVWCVAIFGTTLPFAAALYVLVERPFSSLELLLVDRSRNCLARWVRRKKRKAGSSETDAYHALGGSAAPAFSSPGKSMKAQADRVSRENQAPLLGSPY